MQSHLCNRFLKQGIDPFTALSSPRLPPCQIAGHPVVESAQNSPNSRCNDPRLRSVNPEQLNRCQVNLSQDPGICTLPAQHPIQPRPLLTCYPQVVYHCWLVAVRRRENSPTIIEGGYWGEGDPIGCDLQLCPRLCLLLFQAKPLLIFSPAEKGCRELPAVEGLVWYELMIVYVY